MRNIPPPPPANRKPFALVAFIATALFSLVPLEQSQAQIYIDVYPSQDNPTTHTLWIFSGSSIADRSFTLFATTNYAQGTIRTSSGNAYDEQDTARLSTSPFNANTPNNAVLALTPFSVTSSSTNYPKDYDSIRRRIPGGTRSQLFAANATNTPTLRIGADTQTISHMYLHGATNGIGPRVSTAFTYGESSTEGMNWRGAGLLAKPIGDFNAGTFNSLSPPTQTGTFFSRPANTFQFRVHSAVIPEPEQYALILGLFALGFVILRRHFQKKRQARM